MAVGFKSIVSPSAILLLAALALHAQDSVPDTSAQERMLAAMRAYAEQYISNLPDFICQQVTRQFEAGRKPNHWRKGDVLTSRLLFSDGDEHRTLELVNDKAVRPGSRSWRTPLQTEGEFGILLANVLDPKSDAAFTWKDWEALQGRRVAVFDYSIDVSHSTLSLSLSDLAKATVPYHGSVYADPESGAVWRITNGASDLPPEIQTKSIATVIDYGPIAIAGKTYLLPVAASVSLSTGRSNVRNDLEFRDYRKFEADSVIKFASTNDSGQDAAPKN